MLYFKQKATLLGTSRSRQYALLIDPGLRIYACHHAGLGYDSRAFGSFLPKFGAQSRLRRPIGQAVFPLRGEFNVHTAGAWKSWSRGATFIDGLPCSQERWDGQEFCLLVVEWTAAGGEAFSRVQDSRISPQDTRRLESFARQLLAGQLQGPPAQEAASGLIAQLRTLGVPLRSPEPRLPGPPLRAQEIAHALSEAHCTLERQPMWVDFVSRMGLSERHLRREFHGLFRWMRMDSQDVWRSPLRVIRAKFAISLLGSAEATAEAVARSLGYGSSRALGLALDQLGMPSAAEIQRMVLGKV